MIRNDAEYQETSARLEQERARLDAHTARLAESGLGAEEIERALEPLYTFHIQLVDEVEQYERLKRGQLGQLGELVNLHGLGEQLIALRIARGMTQRELAARLGVHESSVSRDERNAYHGITVERASRVLDALGVELRGATPAVVLPLERDVA